VGFYGNGNETSKSTNVGPFLASWLDLWLWKIIYWQRKHER